MKRCDSPYPGWHFGCILLEKPHTEHITVGNVIGVEPPKGYTGQSPDQIWPQVHRKVLRWPVGQPCTQPA